MHIQFQIRKSLLALVCIGVMFGLQTDPSYAREDLVYARHSHTLTQGFDFYTLYDQKKNTICRLEHNRRWNISFYNGSVIIVGDINDVYPVFSSSKIKKLIDRIPNVIDQSCRTSRKFNSLLVETISYSVYARVQPAETSPRILTSDYLASLFLVGQGTYALPTLSPPRGAKPRPQVRKSPFAYTTLFEEFRTSPQVLTSGLQKGLNLNQLLDEKQKYWDDRNARARATKLASAKRKRERIASNERRAAERRRQARIRAAEDAREQAAIQSQQRDLAASQSASTRSSFKKVKTWYGFSLGDEVSSAERSMKAWITKHKLGSYFFKKADINRKISKVGNVSGTFSTCFQYRDKFSDSYTGKQCIYHKEGRVIGVWQDVYQISCLQRLTLKNQCWTYPNQILEFYKGKSRWKLISEDNETKGRWDQLYEVQNGYLHLRRKISTSYLQYSERVSMSGGVCLATVSSRVC